MHARAKVGAHSRTQYGHQQVLRTIRWEGGAVDAMLETGLVGHVIAAFPDLDLIMVMTGTNLAERDES